MKLVLLPGLHGTGELFQPLLPYLDIPLQIIELPEMDADNAEIIACHISTQLPEEPVVILAESFSGSLVPGILNSCQNRIVGVIFVASFISCPNKFYVQCCRLLPRFLTKNRSLVTLALTLFFLNGRADRKMLELCVRTVLSISSKILKSRLKILADLDLPNQKFNVPAVYIQAINDRVVNEKSAHNVTCCFDTKLLKLVGPHFILQAKPEESAIAIRKALELLQVD